jgi:quinol-cytochrome oxidoreductase complex cytochrome b subunit
MRKNESILDRIIRAVIGITLLVLVLALGLSGAIKWVLLIAGAIILITALLGFCAIYKLLGISTYKENKRE